MGMNHLMTSPRKVKSRIQNPFKSTTVADDFKEMAEAERPALSNTPDHSAFGNWFRGDNVSLLLRSNYRRS